MIVYFLIACLCALILYWYKLYFHYEKYISTFPGPTPLPLIGNVHQLDNLTDPIKILSKFTEQYGITFTGYVGFYPPGLITSDVKLTEYILSSNTILDKGTSYKFFYKWLGTGLLTSTGQKWKKHRKMLTPSFHFKILEQFVNVFDLFGSILVSKLEHEVGKSSVNIYSPISLCTLDVICATSMGTNINAQQNSTSDYVNAVQSISKIITTRMQSSYKSIDMLYQFTNDARKESKLLDLLHKFSNSVIKSRIREISSKPDNENVSNDLGIKRRLTFLDTMLQYQYEGDSISNEEIRQEVDTFMFEGHDTTAAGISFTLYCLANHPEVQERVVQELKMVFEDRNRKVTYQDLQDMKYLEMVIKESLRLYPPVPLFSRILPEDVQYESFTLPKKLEVIVFVYGLHRNPNIYSNPEKFDPERFSIENQSKRSPYAFVPFSAGSRNCIGQKFAMLEMKSVVSAVLRNFILLPATPKHIPDVVGHIVLNSRNGVCINLKKRDS